MRFPWQKAEPADPALVVAEFVAHLREKWPQIEVKNFDAEHLELVMPDGAEAKLYLHKLHSALAALRGNAKARRKIYEGFAQQMLAADKQIPSMEALNAEEMSTKIFPRVMPKNTIEVWAAQTGDEMAPPLRPLAETDFIVVYVLDFDDRVAYVMNAQAEALKMDEAALWQCAMQNARSLFSRAQCRAALAGFSPKKVTQFLECPESHASARLLVLPEYLEESEEIAAVILENSAFLLAQVPPNNNWNPLRNVARQAGSPHVHQPFLVTARGIKAM